MKDTISFYDRICRLYPCIGWLLSGQKKKLVRLIGALPAGALLEIGTGDGSLLYLLDRHQCTGIDTSAGMLRLARKKMRPGGPAFKLMDGELLQFPDNHFDYLVLNHVLAVTPHPERMLQEAYRVLRPDGLLFLHNHFTPDNMLRYIDRSISGLAARFRFRSVFRADELASLKRFRRLTAISTAPFAYFQLFIFRK